MSLVELVNSWIGPLLGMLLARILPRRTAYWLADALAAATARRGNLALVQAVRSNQAVVRGLGYDHPALGLAVEQVLRNAARGYVDLFRAMAGGVEGLVESCVFDEDLDKLIRNAQQAGRGGIAVSAHLSCFDMLLLSLSARGLPPQALSYSNPRGSYRVQNALRRRFGVDLTPLSPQALRQAIRRLRRGGIVITGVDRPAPEGEELVLFGRRARLPIGHARLAIHTGSPILIVTCRSDGERGYRAGAKALIDPKEYAGGKGDTVALAQHVASLLEECIRERPEEWFMFFPVWPETLPRRAS